MRVAVNCPFCKRPMATSMAFAGQTIACPNCRGEFVFQPPGVTPPAAVTTADSSANGGTKQQAAGSASPGSSSATAVAASPREERRAATESDAMPPPIPGLSLRSAAVSEVSVAPTTSPPAATSPNASVRTNTARFKTAASAGPTIVPAADGKLPGLLLAEGGGPNKTGETGEKGIPLWLACLAVLGSTAISVILLLGDGPAMQSIATRQTEARNQIAQFYGSARAPLLPFQVLLREAQLAHSRGDRTMERQKYRQVMGLLRSEKRSKYESITGTPNDDEQLTQWLSVLLSNE